MLHRGDGDGGISAVEKRLAADQREVDAEMPRLLQQRDARGRLGDPGALTRTAVETRALERFLSGGERIFETRAITRTDASAACFVRPLVGDLGLRALRAGRAADRRPVDQPGAAIGHRLDQPAARTFGPATGAQASDTAAVASRDLTDSFAQGIVGPSPGRSTCR